jgi:hypothetical protein
MFTQTDIEYLRKTYPKENARKVGLYFEEEDQHLYAMHGGEQFKMGSITDRARKTLGLQPNEVTEQE